MKLMREGAVDGVAVFQFVDSKGLPLEIILQRLAIDGLTVDMPGFVLAAVASGNFTTDRLLRLLREAFDTMGVTAYRGSDSESKVMQLDTHYRSLGRDRLKALLAAYKSGGQS